MFQNQLSALFFYQMTGNMINTLMHTHIQYEMYRIHTIVLKYYIDCIRTMENEPTVQEVYKANICKRFQVTHNYIYIYI